MKELRAISIATAATLALVSPAVANPTQVTNVRLNPNGAGFDVVLETQGGKAPQVFNVNRGNTWNAYVFNAQITQPFRQNNPAPGIAQISVIPSGANGVQVTVVGTNAAPIGQIAARNEQGVIFNVSGAGGGSTPTNQPNAAVPMNVPAQAQSTPSASLPTAPVAQALPNSTTPVAPFVPSAQVPNQGQPNVPVAPAPPLLRRAIAPPVGDQAISQIDASPTTIDLGTNERIPRLVLRDAPVREVLSLLARAARLNLAYTEPPSAGQQGQQGAKSNGPTISLDIENESVQDVFNYVLRVACVAPTLAVTNAGGFTQCASLEANRVGRTLFVGPRLPDDARNSITRTIRLNQVSAADAAGFLTTQGAETQIQYEQIQLQTVGEGAAARTIEIRTPTILPLRANDGSAPLILRGVSISTNARLNSVTLTGSPRKIEIATRLLGQLDARKRQVALNVKIVDVNLLKTDDFNTSFSFGVGNNFFSVDRGAALFNFGSVRPPTNAEVSNSLTGRPITGNLFPQGVDLEPFLDAPSGAPYSGGRTNVPIFNDISTARPPFGTSNNPLQPGVTEITPPTRDAVTGRITDPGSVTFGLPTLFQFPSRFLARLQSQVTSGNAKILTDPTVVVQDGETSTVKLTQEVFSGFRRSGFLIEEPIIREAGLILKLVVDRIDDNGFITLRVNPTISAPSNSVTSPQGQITLITGRSIESGAIRVRDGQTLI
ncbi:AMIN domain-containing protein, partial [Pseudanabaenaceae cyanobacterium LEGE 13415]|nr:AMIN domain-containing protein [Pseudanabaenaceae cyanobacterium LEGE 13415]